MPHSTDPSPSDDFLYPAESHPEATGGVPRGPGPEPGETPPPAESPVPAESATSPASATESPATGEARSAPAEPEPPPPAASPAGWTTAYTSQVPQPSPSDRIAAAQLAVFLIACTVAGVVLGGSLCDFVLAASQVVPFALLGILAYLGLRYQWALVLAWLWHIVLLLGFTTLPIAFSLALISVQARESGAVGRAVLTSVPREAWIELLVVSLWCAAGVAVAAVVLLPAVRRAVARWLPIDPASMVHAFALSMVLGLTVMFLGQLIATGAEPILLALIKTSREFADELGKADVMGPMLFGLVWTIPACILCAGFPVVRGLSESLERLGFVRPTTAQVFGALGIAAVLAGLAWGLDQVISTVWKLLGWPLTDQEAFEKLLQSLTTPTGAVVIAVTAGVGEEIAVRGVLQPRLGIWLSNLFFTSLHAFQYGFDGLLSVFLVGTVLGFVRQRTNTTTSAIVHGTYDYILVMAPIVLGQK